LPRIAFVRGSELDTAVAFNLLLNLPQATVPGCGDTWNDGSSGTRVVSPIFCAS
jgi:hypothetical protein